MSAKRAAAPKAPARAAAGAAKQSKRVTARMPATKATKPKSTKVARGPAAAKSASKPTPKVSSVAKLQTVAKTTKPRKGDSAPKKQQPQSKIAARKVTPAAPEKSSARKSAPPPIRVQAPKPAKAATIAARKAPANTGKDKSMEETAKPAARAVVRIARGLRTPKAPPAPVAAAPEPPKGPRTVRREGGGAAAAARRAAGPKVEINPRLERSKHLIKSTPPPEAAPAGKTMSVAAKHRAAAEAVFAKLTVAEAKPAEAGAAAEGAAATPMPFSARPPDQGGGSYQMRISEHDSAVTALRLASSPAETLDAARNLADRFKLPPDQSLLLRVVALGDARLTKLALEELLELEDRGRVRPTPELKNVLGALQSTDPETREIRQLFLEKIGVAP